MGNRIGILAIRYNQNLLDSYCIDLAEKLREILAKLIIVSKNKYTVFENDYFADVSFENNNLYNYYACGIRYINENLSLSDYDELVMLDDSFFGPLTSFSDIFDKADKECFDADVWGISDSYVNIRSGLPFKFALHTYFLTIRRISLSSKIVVGFFCGKYDYSDEEFLYKFSECLHVNNLNVKSLFYSNDDENDQTIYNLSALLSLGFPVVRREAFIVSYGDIISKQLRSDAARILEYVDNNTDYDVDMIYNSIIRKSDPFELLSVFGNHFIVDDYYSGSISRKSDAVIVFHMYYEDLFDENLEILDTAAEYLDIIITTTSSDKVRLIGEKSHLYSHLKNVKILCSQGNGRDMAGLLVEARPYLSKYSYIGFTHDKKSSHHQKASGEGFKKIITDNILHSAGYVANVFSIFENNPHIGLLVPPAPEHASYFSSIGRRWCNDYAYFDSLCIKLGIKNIVKRDWSPFSLGTSFWCRYDALKTLFEYEWSHCDFPDEPLPLDGSISHAIERCFPFIAMHNDYLSGIIYTREFASEYLNMREYILTNFFTLMNKSVSMEKNCFSEYKCKVDNSFSAVSVKNLKKKLRNQKKNLRIISSSIYFDKKWYLEKYPDVSLSGLSPAEHYLYLGWNEGKNPSDRFNSDVYLRINKDVESKSINPLIHYERYGKAEGRRICYDEGDYRVYGKKRDRQRKKGIDKYKSIIEKNKNAKILVILHLFYMCSWKEIKEYLKNLDIYNYKLIVTYTSDNEDKAVLDNIRSYKPDTELFKFPNLGYDVGSFTDVIQKVDLEKYDIIFKLQSKGVNRRRIYIYGQYLKKRDWFLNLFEGCIGAETVHITVDKLLNNPQIGLVAAENLIVEDPSHKQNMVKCFMAEKNIQIPSKYLFVAGTCFAVKAKTMKPIQELRLNVDNYKSASASFSLAHKMERVVCLVVLNSGFEFFGNDVLKFRRMIRKIDPFYRKVKNHIGINLLLDNRFKLDDEFVYFSLEHKMVKQYKLVEIPVGTIKRRWINEVIPITECYPYRYLVSGDPAIYDEYCELNKKHYNLDIMSRERFDNLMKSIDENGFFKENVIVINQDNIIMDGQHRCCYMLYKYGKDYKIPCLKIYEYPSVSIKNNIKNFLTAHLSKANYNRIAAFYRKIKKL